jgi:hypothetical protein
MSSVSFENQILDAIETVVSNAISNAEYDKTIKAIVIELTDASLGKYKLRYQDSEIEAYTNNIDIYYPAGTLVSILIPNSDFSQTKTIIDAVEKNKVEYSTIVEADEEYNTEGGNAIAATQEFGLCSYKPEDIQILYSRDANINDINLDTLAFEEYILNASTIICGAKFRTDLDANQKIKGNYGIVFEIDFKDNLSGDIVTKIFKIDINQMRGDPYALTTAIRQYKIFNVNGENFDSVNRIYIFSNNFPNTKTENFVNDIFISDFELSSGNKMTESELTGYSLTIAKSGKGYFNDTIDSMTLTASLKNNNKDVSNNNIEFF